MNKTYSIFPLDERAIVRSAVGRALCAPVTWMPLVPFVAAPQLWELPTALGLGGAVLGGLALYWRLQWDGLTRTVRREMIRNRQADQNAALRRAAGSLRLRGARAEADMLGQFVSLKLQIESRLCACESWNEQKIRIEELIEGLCFGARDALFVLIERQKAGVPVQFKEVTRKVTAALATLWETANEIDSVLAPFEAGAGVAGPSLEDLTRRLREEAEISAEVRAMLAEPVGMPCVTRP